MTLLRAALLALLLVGGCKSEPAVRQFDIQPTDPVLEQYVGPGWRMTKFMDGTWWYTTWDGLIRDVGVAHVIEWRWK